MVGAGAAEGEKMPTWFQHSEAFGPQSHVVGDTGSIPFFSHKPELIRWVGDDAVNTAVGDGGEDVEVVAVEDLGGHRVSLNMVAQLSRL